MLRGMGWKKGEAIGGTNKGLTVPIEFIPRSQGLGLGAERRHEDDGKKCRRKPGDAKSSEVEIFFEMYMGYVHRLYQYIPYLFCSLISLP